MLEEAGSPFLSSFSGCTSMRTQPLMYEKIPVTTPLNPVMLSLTSSRKLNVTGEPRFLLCCNLYAPRTEAVKTGVDKFFRIDFFFATLYKN